LVGTDCDDAPLETLIFAVIAKEDGAWAKLWQALEPRLLGILGRPRVLGRLATSEDDRRNVVVEVMARLAEDDHHRLRLYVDARSKRPGLSFMPWLIVVTKRIAIDYMRAHGDYVDRRHESDASANGRWVVPGTLPSASKLGAARPPYTNRGTAQEMIRFAGQVLSEDQRAALKLWIEGNGFDAIAGELGNKSAKDAERLVRAALERLRRRFRESKEGGE
jgi:DNA-directed RNA polymerase specialized sigma24 family protein